MGDTPGRMYESVLPGKARTCRWATQVPEMRPYVRVRHLAHKLMAIVLYALGIDGLQNLEVEVEHLIGAHDGGLWQE